MIGRALNGRYELVGTIGAGGMATVYHGVDRVLGRPVAVKILNGGLAEDPRFAERFSREAQHAAMLVHPRIAMVFDSGMDQGSPYIVMELVRGRALSSLVAEAGPMPIERAVGIAAAVCEALEVAHAAGLVHRDIKPGNVMITDDGGVKVVDFGIARANAAGGQQLTQTATVLGTAAYLSPEQATAAEVDGRADLYALGCVLTEMLTGEPPFTADTPVAIAFKQVTEEAPPVSLLRPEVPPALDHVVARLLAKRPADRPASAAAARAELLAAVPVSGAVNRTSELLAMSASDGDRTAVLPPTAVPDGFGGAPDGFGGRANGFGGGAGGFGGGPAPTSLLAALPEESADRPAPARSRRTMALLLGGAGIAVAAVVGVLVLADSGSSKASSNPPAAAPAGAATTAPTGAGTPGGATTAPSAANSARPTPGTPAAEVAALRADVQGTTMPKDRQAPLVKTLDAAEAALAAQRPDQAVQALKAAQRQVRDLAKKHTVDGPTTGAWQRQLGTVIGQLSTAGGGTDAPGGGAGGGDNGGDGGDNGN
ncbi:protein kinase domain-containing protein [Kitasatospora viridis]|uniref:non-specific serine/threonine protein kinase n=1 Tax=Kitasatospora viridis TaxID=281105 RepID=A0A561UIK3_9ACTN|nr:protein kinase [Kitasatospora viridis]TWF99185.1 serine/threonine-protein kinase [Kitasatospora viridis]